MNQEFWETHLSSSLIFAVLGPIVEIICTGRYARFKLGDKRWMGHVSVKMIPAYALLGFFVPFWYTAFSDNMFVTRRFADALLVHILEFSFGALLLWWTGEYHWHYNDALNLGHHTTLKLFPLFFFLSWVFEWLVLHVEIGLK